MKSSSKRLHLPMTPACLGPECGLPIHKVAVHSRMNMPPAELHSVSQDTEVECGHYSDPVSLAT